jgi:hypothetical protein
MGNITDERTSPTSPSDLEHVKERAQGAAEQAKAETRTKLREQIDTRTTEAGEQIGSTAQAIRRASQQLREEGNDRAAEMIDAVADRAQRLGSYLTRADGDALLRDVEDFARRQPWLVAGAGAVAGFLSSRFLKASADSRYQERSSIERTASRPARPPSPSVAGGGASGVR